jgi:hypothetical protein
MGKAKERSSLTHRATIYQVDSHCPREAETGLADEAITELNAVRALEGDVRLVCDPTFRLAGGFLDPVRGASKRAVALEVPTFCFSGSAGNTLLLRPVLLRFYPRHFSPKRNPDYEILQVAVSTGFIQRSRRGVQSAIFILAEVGVCRKGAPTAGAQNELETKNEN